MSNEVKNILTQFFRPPIIYRANQRLFFNLKSNQLVLGCSLTQNKAKERYGNEKSMDVWLAGNSFVTGWL